MNRIQAIYKINRLLQEGFNPTDPTGYFDKKKQHRDTENKVNQCILFLRSSKYRRLKEFLETEAGIIVRDKIFGRNKIVITVELDPMIYELDRSVYTFTINYYNVTGNGNPITPSHIMLLNYIKRSCKNEPEIILALTDIFDGLLK